MTEHIVIEGGAAAALAFAMASAMAPRGVRVEGRVTMTTEEEARVVALLEEVGLPWRAPSGSDEVTADTWRFDGEASAIERERLRDLLSERFTRMED